MTAIAFGSIFAPIPIGPSKAWGVLYPLPGGNWNNAYGLGIQASLNIDAIWRMAFLMPTAALPTGTPWLRLWGLANATTGTAQVNPKWGMCASGADPAAVVLSVEGPQPIAWLSTDANKLKLTSVRLDATTILAGQMLLMDLVFQTSGWSLAAVSVWFPYLEFV